MKKELKRHTEAALNEIALLSEDLQNRIDDLEEKQSESETEARQEKIDQLSSIKDLCDTAEQALNDVLDEIESL